MPSLAVNFFAGDIFINVDDLGDDDENAGNRSDGVHQTAGDAQQSGEFTAGRNSQLESADGDDEDRQQQDQAVDAGRDGQRQNGVADLTEKTERKDARELEQIFRKESPFGKAAKSIV